MKRDSPFWMHLAPLLLLLLAFTLRVHHLEQQSLWWDEIKTVQRATISIPDMLNDIISKRGHLPLYFLLIRPFTHISTGAFAMRYFSVIFSVLGVGMMYVIGRFIGGRRVGLLAMALLAISPLHVWYGQEARMYSLLPFLILLGHWLLLRALRDNRPADWIGYTAVMIAAVYTHYFTTLVLLAHAIFFTLHLRAMWQSFARWLLSAVLIGGSGTVWFSIIYRQSQYNDAVPGWIPTATAADPIYTLLAFSAGRTIDPTQWLPWLALVVCSIGALTALTLARRSPPQWLQLSPSWSRTLHGRFLLLWLLLPLTVVTIVSLDFPLRPTTFSIYVDRYLLLVQPAWLLLVAWGWGLLARRAGTWLLPLALLLLGLPTAVSLQQLYTNPAYARTDWRGAFTTVAAERAPGDVLLGGEDILLPWQHYRQSEMPFLALPPAAASPEETAVFNDVMQQQVTAVAADHDRAWLVTAVHDRDPHGFLQPVDPDKWMQVAWMDARFTSLARWTFTDVQLVLYDLSPPR